MKIRLNIHPWRNWITQQIPILENGGSNPFGWAKKNKRHPLRCFLFFIYKETKGFEADR